MGPSLPFFIALFSNNSLISGVVLVLLLLFSALISGSEVAFFSLNQIQLDTESKTFKNRKLVARLLDNPKRLLATILVANNFINIATVLLFAHAFDPYFDAVNVTIDLYLFKFQLSLFSKKVVPACIVALNKTSAFFKKLNGLAIKPENFSLFLLAYTLGNISPKSNIKKVATTIL